MEMQDAPGLHMGEWQTQVLYVTAIGKADCTDLRKTSYRTHVVT